MGKENIKVVSRGKWLLSVEFIQDSSYKYTCRLEATAYLVLREVRGRRIDPGCFFRVF